MLTPISMIYVSYSRIERELPNQQWEAYVDGFPKEVRKRMAAFKKWEDAHLSLFGKLLLLNSLQNWGYDRDVFQRIRYSAYNRPYLPDAKGIDFNISHAGAYVVCVVSDALRVGIDIEPLQAIELSDFESCMRGNEWEKIGNADDKYQAFYEYWTKKEAATKANGMGLSIPLKQVAIEDDQAFIEEQPWYLREIPVAEKYLCYLATEVPVTADLSVTRIDFMADPL